MLLIIIVLLAAILLVLLFGASAVQDGFISCMTLLVAVLVLALVLIWAKNASFYDWLTIAGILCGMMILISLYFWRLSSQIDTAVSVEPIDEFADIWKAFGQIAHRVDDEFMEQAWIAYDTKDLHALQIIYREAQEQLTARKRDAADKL
ncbi:MAG: hypothetical protein Pars2KO_04050 [Parasphingorhabdus sp.]